MKNMLIKTIFIILWAPGFLVALPLRIIYQGVIIGIKAADDILEKTT